ncbi:hypothetical protein SPRG_07708 [Saprolegnia parasitica CBS 223.65]|uniref:Dolichol phosphate-mannose biosynthesis regulatory protein n=1 Tax=Saprolegnia parasitica (strain CBS 223.65) TaxID=695850 RepID=A0A067CCT2_SAPPC|nr:hypothetical protein SPRG_07708 [Saprolegnia parasitica CBS 223.65]KDO26995.1 hypothetical protein SPRG_07708 [Saprolegnia parasitica CBS 223.65]|eukprot:XP_012202376.1 hypothetical protein SPRG_07708 [Saprolegnia parasitica CBS 223.65]
MGASSDQTVGAILLAISVSTFAYYTLWVIITPFVDKDHVVQGFFPDRHYAIAIPAILLVIFLTICSTFIGLVMIKSKHTKEE